MSQKIHFSVHFCNLANDEACFFVGANARNILQALTGPEFCVDIKNIDGKARYLLTDRIEMIFNPQAAPVDCFRPRYLIQNGLYIHKSVMSRLEALLQHWNKQNDLFLEEFGFGSPAPLQKAVETLVHFGYVHNYPNSDFVGVLQS